MVIIPRMGHYPMKVTVFSSSSLNTTRSGFFIPSISLPNICPLRGTQDRKLEEVLPGRSLVGKDDCGGIGPVFF